MADDFGVLGSARVIIQGDDAAYQQTVSKLPEKIAAAERKIQAAMARARLEFSAKAQGGYAMQEDFDAYAKAAQSLSAKLAAVQLAAGKAAGAAGQGAAGYAAAAGASRQYAAAVQMVVAAQNQLVAASRAAGANPGNAPLASAARAAQQQYLAAVNAANQIPQAAAAAGTALVGMGQKGAMGGMKLMILAQTMDDLQYGFRAIVNNIPMLLQAFGVPDKVAAALSIGAVALNQFIQKWPEWSDLLKDTPLRPLIEEVDRLAAAWTHAGDAAKFHAKAKQEAAQKATADAGAVAGIEAAGTRERGAGAREAIEAFGGGGKLSQWLLDNKRGAMGYKQAEALFNDYIRRATEGDGDALKFLGDNTRGTSLPASLEYHSPEAKAARAQAEKDKKESDAANAEAIAEHNKQVTDAKKAEEKKADAELRAAIADAEPYAESLKKGKDRTSQVFAGVESYLQAIQTAALGPKDADKVPGKLDEVKGELKEVNRNLGKLRMARFG